jgi:hypothetical protein
MSRSGSGRETIAYRCSDDEKFGGAGRNGTADTPKFLPYCSLTPGMFTTPTLVSGDLASSGGAFVTGLTLSTLSLSFWLRQSIARLDPISASAHPSGLADGFPTLSGLADELPVSPGLTGAFGGLPITISGSAVVCSWAMAGETKTSTGKSESMIRRIVISLVRHAGIAN